MLTIDPTKEPAHAQSAEVKLVNRWFEEVWNNKRDDLIDEMVADTAVIHGIKDAFGNEVTGVEPFKKFHKSFVAAFPDVRVSVNDIIVSDQRAATRCTVTGTHRSHLGEIAPTEKPVEFTGVCITKIENNRIVEAWNNFDFLALYEQLGLQLKAK